MSIILKFNCHIAIENYNADDTISITAFDFNTSHIDKQISLYVMTGIGLCNDKCEVLTK